MLRRNPLIVLLSIEIMLNSVEPAAWSRSSRYVGGNDGQVFALVVMGVAAAEVVVGLGLVVALARRELVLDTDELGRCTDERRRLGWIALAAPLAGCVLRSPSRVAGMLAHAGRLGRLAGRCWSAFAASLGALRASVHEPRTDARARLDRLDVAHGRRLPGRHERSWSTRSAP